MKEINEMSMDELAEYAVTLPGWKWELCDGIKIKDTRIVVAAVLGGEPKLITHHGSFATSFRPDLEDPATVGCILAMARERHGSESRTTCSIDGVWGFVAGRPQSHAIICEIKSPTEVHALGSALLAKVEI